MAKIDHLLDRHITLIQTIVQSPAVSANSDITPLLQELQTNTDALRAEFGSEGHKSTLFAPLKGTNAPAPAPIPVLEQRSTYVDKTSEAAKAVNINQAGAAGPALSDTNKAAPTPTPTPTPTPSSNASVSNGGSTSY